MHLLLFVKTILQKQHSFTQLEGHHQAGIGMKFEMAVHKYQPDDGPLVGLKHVAFIKTFNIIIKDTRVVFDGPNFIVLIVSTQRNGHS
jgi:hypothetical protein